MAVDFSMVAAAGGTVNSLLTFRSGAWLWVKRKVAGIAGLKATDQAGLLCDVADVIAVADPAWLRQSECAIISFVVCTMMSH